MASRVCHQLPPGRSDALPRAVTWCARDPRGASYQSAARGRAGLLLPRIQRDPFQRVELPTEARSVRALPERPPRQAGPRVQVFYHAAWMEPVQTVLIPSWDL